MWKQQLPFVGWMGIYISFLMMSRSFIDGVLCICSISNMVSCRSFSELISMLTIQRPHGYPTKTSQRLRAPATATVAHQSYKLPSRNVEGDISNSKPHGCITHGQTQFSDIKYIYMIWYICVYIRTYRMYIQCILYYVSMSMQRLEPNSHELLHIETTKVDASSR